MVALWLLRTDVRSGEQPKAVLLAVRRDDAEVRTALAGRAAATPAALR